MIAGDWHKAQIALQIIAERGPGRAYFAAEEAENFAVNALARGMRRG